MVISDLIEICFKNSYDKGVKSGYVAKLSQSVGFMENETYYLAMRFGKGRSAVLNGDGVTITDGILNPSDGEWAEAVVEEGADIDKAKLFANTLSDKGAEELYRYLHFVRKCRVY
jgi:hypothetical protein